jgi:hypothetical protein
MQCNAMHPIQDLFFGKFFLYVLQFDMHFYMHSYLDKKKLFLEKVGVTGGDLGASHLKSY